MKIVAIRRTAIAPLVYVRTRYININTRYNGYTSHRIFLYPWLRNQRVYTNVLVVRSLVRRWQSLIEANITVKTTDDHRTEIRRRPGGKTVGNGRPVSRTQTMH